MRKSFALMLMTLFVVTGCVTGGTVIRKVSFDKNCPEEQVEIVSSHKSMGQGSYKVEACGQNYIYEHAGTVVYEKGNGPL